MNRIYLKKTEHPVKIGQLPADIPPNIKESCILYENDKVVGLFVKDIRDYDNRVAKLLDIANREFRSKRVPKTMLNRGSKKQAKDKGLTQVSQYSTVLGYIPPKPHFKRNYASASSVHSVDSAKKFSKAMNAVGELSYEIAKKITPSLCEEHEEAMSIIPQNRRFAKHFTSSISNFNISAAYHRDGGNVIGAINIIVTKRDSASGGNLHVPDYDAIFDQSDNSMLVYPAWRNMHGVTPISPLREGGYRNSLVFYPLKGLSKIKGNEK